MIKIQDVELLIVTHIGDWGRCVNLLDSIDTYLTGCKITVIDNTPIPEIEINQLKNNFVRIIPWTDVLTSQFPCACNIKGSGWIYQQLLKIMAYKLFKSKYVILDSDSFINKTFEYWDEDFYRQPHFLRNFPGFLDYCYNYLDVPNILKIRSPQIPYVFDPAEIELLISQWESSEDFQKWFCNSPVLPSEFMLYDLWIQRYDPFQKQKYRDRQRVQFVSDISELDEDTEIGIYNTHQTEALCIVAHPDDCIIYAYAYIHANFNLKWKIVYLTHDKSSDRGEEIYKFWLKRGVQVEFLGFNDNPLDMQTDVISFDQMMAEHAILTEIERTNADLILTHNENGEYGHIHHKFVNRCCVKYRNTATLVTFDGDEVQYSLPQDSYSIDETPLHSTAIQQFKQQTNIYSYNIDKQ